MSKIKKFRELILEGKTREEARDEAGVADATSKIQVYKMKKEGLLKEETTSSTNKEEEVEKVEIIEE